MRHRTVVHDVLTAELACDALRTAGLHLRPADVDVEARDARWLVRLPAGQLAWFASSELGEQRLAVERRVLRLLEARCTFEVPRVRFEAADGDFDVRSMVPGACDPWTLYTRVLARPELGAKIGAEIGTILAQQHTRIGPDDVAGWLPRRPAWPEPRDWVCGRVRRVVSDAELVADVDAIMDAYAGTSVSEADRVLVHTDVGFHNLALDPVSDHVRGIFDYDGAAWADRHHDFRYLVFDQGDDGVLDAAVAAYEPLVGHAIRRERVLLYNAACAVTFLAHRDGSEPEARPCGRTLSEDLRWSTRAIARVLRP